MKFTEELRSSLLPAERKNFFEVKINGFPRSEPAKGLTRIRMKRNQGGASIDSSEVTRARVFSDAIALRSQAGVAGAPKEILAKEEELVTRVAALKKERASKEKGKDPVRYENITKEIEKAEAALNTFVEMLWEKYQAYAAFKYPRPVTLKGSSLRPEEHVVIFDVSGEGVGVKLIKGKEIAETSYKKWKLEDLEKDVKRFRQPFEQVELAKFDPKLAETLYRNLLSRVLTDVPKGTPLVIIPDGILAILPFEALVVSGKATWIGEGASSYPEGLTYLGDLYPISYYQSITALTLARTLGQKKKPVDRLLVIADPIFDMKDRRAQAAAERWRPVRKSTAAASWLRLKRRAVSDSRVCLRPLPLPRTWAPCLQASARSIRAWTPRSSVSCSRWLRNWSSTDGRFLRPTGSSAPLSRACENRSSPSP